MPKPFWKLTGGGDTAETGADAGAGDAAAELWFLKALKRASCSKISDSVVLARPLPVGFSA